MISQLNDKYAKNTIKCVSQKEDHKALITYLWENENSYQNSSVTKNIMSIIFAT